MIEKMKQRRSIRSYASKEISQELLEELLTVAMQASNTGNMQLYSVVVTRDEEAKKKLSPAHFNQPMVVNAPVVLTFCADANRFVKWAANRKAVAGFENFQTYTAAAIDAMLFAEAFLEAAEEKGLGGCFLGTTTYNADKIVDVLNLPSLVVPIITLTLGYPAEPLPNRSERLPLEAIVHYEQYVDYTPERINTLYAEKESLEVNKQFVIENNKETLAQVFTEVRYTKEACEHFSEVFIALLKKQKFMD